MQYIFTSAVVNSINSYKHKWTGSGLLPRVPFLTNLIYSCESNCIWFGPSFFPGVNKLHITCSWLRTAVMTAVNISHYLKLRNRIYSQVMCLWCWFFKKICSYSRKEFFGTRFFWMQCRKNGFASFERFLSESITWRYLQFRLNEIAKRFLNFVDFWTDFWFDDFLFCFFLVSNFFYCPIGSQLCLCVITCSFVEGNLASSWE